MNARIHIVTLGVRDLDRSIHFYRDGLGWPMSSASNEQIAFFRLAGLVLGLFPRHLLAEDAALPDDGSGFGGITLAQNLSSEAEVDQALNDAVAAGATLLKPGTRVFWGGYSGYFADPDGYPWEIAWNPFFPFADDGSIALP